MTTPAEKYRREVSKVLRPLPDDNNEILHAQIMHFYTELKEMHEDSKARDGLFGPNTNLFIFSIGLLAFGHLEVVEDILENIPGERNNARALIPAILLLLPIPDRRFDAKKIREWFQVHKDRMVWSEEQGQFLLTE